MEPQSEGVGGPAAIIFIKEVLQPEADFWFHGQALQLAENLLAVVMVLQLVQYTFAVAVKQLFINGFHNDPPLAQNI